MYKKWNQKEKASEELIDQLIKSINVSPEMAQLLINRGINDYDSAKAFFRPSITHLYDPYLMKDMQKAVNRLAFAFNNNEKILIYGDYDVDGTTSVALVYGCLSKQYALLEYYIPDRYTEGYGISKQGIEYAKENGFSLIISLDCGIKSVEPVSLAKSYGIDFIICDHHLPGDVLPDAIAVLDPKQSDCNYPYKELSGCGVGFKFLQAWFQFQNSSSDSLFSQLDLVATSIAADIVPITGENRVLTCLGLKKLNENPRSGIKHLLKVGSIKKEIDVNTLVFVVAPRINAAGRLKHAYASVELLLSENEINSDELAENLNEINAERKDLDKSITDEAISMIENNSVFKNAKTTVLFKNDWSKGVVGIVASRCIEHYYRPTIILTESNGKASGSARSVPGFDLYEAISACDKYLLQYGGHAFAAGMTLELDQIDAFRDAFEKQVSATITDDLLTPFIDIDAELPLSRINANFYKVLLQLAPHGPGNLSPLFMARSVEIKSPVRLLKEEHIKFSVKQGNSAIFDVIGFGLKEYYDLVSMNKYVDICFHLSENEYNNKKTFQLMLKDVREAEKK